MRRLALPFALPLALLMACGPDVEPAATTSPLLAASRTVTTTTTTAGANPYQPVQMPFASRAWIDPAAGALVVESCGQVEAFLAGGHTLAEVVEHRSYACGPTVTSKAVAGDRDVADLFTRR